MKLFTGLVFKLKNTLNKPTNLSFVKERKQGTHIPKVIHQVYSDSNLPEPLQDNVNRLKSNNPNWSHLLYDDESMLAYVKQEYPEIYPYYIKIDPAYGACRADLFRYLLIYNEGGAYFDIKSGTNKPLDELVKSDDVYILAHWPKTVKKTGHHPAIPNPNGELQQFHILATRGHPFLKAVIDHVCRNIERYNPIIHGPGASVMAVSGPIVYTNVISPLLNKYPCRLSYNHEELGIYYSCLDGLHTHYKVYTKKHYCQLTMPIIKQSPLINSLYYVSYSIKKLLLG